MLRTIGSSLMTARAIGLRGSSFLSSPPPNAQVVSALLLSTPIRSFSKAKSSKKAYFYAQQQQQQQQQQHEQPIPSPSEQKMRVTTETNTAQQQVKGVDEESEMAQNIERMPWLGKMAYKITNYFSDQPLLELRAEKVYLAAENAANTDELLALCGFKRDYSAWFKLTLLHLWIYFARLRYAGEGSQALQQTLLDKFWSQAEINMVASGVTRGMLLAKYMKKNGLFLFGFQVSLDLGIRDGDSSLASCLWRNVFFGSDNVSAKQIASLVKYVHKQLHALDKQDNDTILCGEGRFVPL